MEDKRITKTKKNLRQTLHELLEEKPFAKITVKEICDRAMTNRVTFYTHYEDKYDLLQDVLAEAKGKMFEEFYQLQEKNNREDRPVLSFRNMLRSILDFSFHQEQILKLNTDESNMEILLASYRYISECLHELEVEYKDYLRPRYEEDAVNALIAAGIWGFVHGADTGKMTEEEIYRDAENALADLINSDLFVHK